MAKRKWELSSNNTAPFRPFKGKRKDAVQEAAELTELAGTKVYVQPKGARFIPKGKGQNG